jgi:hypothetical protein
MHDGCDLDIDAVSEEKRTALITSFTVWLGTVNGSTAKPITMGSSVTLLQVQIGDYMFDVELPATSSREDVREWIW